MFYISKGTEHSFRLDDEPVLVMTFQPGLENYFVERGITVSEYELPPECPTEEKVAKSRLVSERYGMEITGPPAGMNSFQPPRGGSTRTRLLEKTAAFSRLCDDLPECC